MIPKRLIRTLPLEVNDMMEESWAGATALHPEWVHVTLLGHFPNPPYAPETFPLTSHMWGKLPSGGVLADLMRAEDLYTRGGFYIDSDVTVFKPFDNLLGHSAVLGYEPGRRPGGINTLCNATMGFAPGHPGLLAYIKAVEDRLGKEKNTYRLGVHLFSDVLSQYPDVFVLPPGSFYPYSWHQREKYAPWTELHAKLPETHPWAYSAHHWASRWKPHDGTRGSGDSFDRMYHEFQTRKAEEL